MRARPGPRGRGGGGADRGCSDGGSAGSKHAGAACGRRKSTAGGELCSVIHLHRSTKVGKR